MIDSTYAGEIVIDTLFLTGPRGSWEMKDIIMQTSVYENIFAKGTFATFKVLDVDDTIGDLLMSGEETILFQFHHISPDTEESQIATYIFAINKVTTIQGEGGLQKAKTYTIECVSPETLVARTGLIQKNWNNVPISSMVGDIFNSELGSPRGLANEPTKGGQDFRASNIKAFSAIEQLQKRGVSAVVDSSAYVFFENRDSWHFQTLQALYLQDPIKILKQTDAIGSGHNDDLDQQIIHFTIVSMLNVEARLKMGAVATRVSTFDQRTRDFADKVFNPTSFFNNGGFEGAYSRIGKSLHIPLNTRAPTSFIPSDSPGTATSAADMMQLIVQLQVFGDTIFQAGKTIDINIPKSVSLTAAVPPDPIVSGKFLISKLRHNIEASTTRPRYTCIVEGIRGNFNTELS